MKSSLLPLSGTLLRWSPSGRTAILIRRALALLTIVLAAPALGPGANAQEMAEDDKILYALGVAVGQNLGQFKLSA